MLPLTSTASRRTSAPSERRWAPTCRFVLKDRACCFVLAFHNVGSAGMGGSEGWLLVLDRY
jgi:hypothetical protein